MAGDGAEHGRGVAVRGLGCRSVEPRRHGYAAGERPGTDRDHADDDVRVVGAGGEVRDDVLGRVGLADDEDPADGLGLAPGGRQVAVGQFVDGDGDEQSGQQGPERGQSRGGLFGHHARHGQYADENQPVMDDRQYAAGLPERPGRVAPAQRLHPGPRHGGGQGAVDGPDLLRRVEDESYRDRGAEQVGGDCGRAVPTGLVPEAPCGRKGLPGRSGHSLRRNMDMPHGPPGTWSMTVAGVHGFPWQRTSAAPGNSTTNTRTVNAVWVNAASCCASVSNRYQAFRMSNGPGSTRR